MKNLSSTLFLLICFISLSAQDQRIIEYPFAEPGTKVTRGVFGDDDRVEVKDAEGFQDFARATAVMVSRNNIFNEEFYSWSLREKIQNKYGRDIKISDDVRFLDQPAIGSCTGFLIAPDILVTAGHCINSMEEAEGIVWVFDYTSDLKFINNRKLNFSEDNIYEVESIITSKLDDETEDDYAVLKLKRKSDRTPYRFRTSGSVLNGGAINTIGSPKGLPLKFSTNAVVVDISPSNWFKSDIDSFPGNSGGPVFDENGFLEGILVRGAVTYDDDWSLTGDYYYDSDCECIKTVQWNSVRYTAGCQAHKITSVPGFALIMAVYENLHYAVINNLSDRFDTWNAYNWIYNHDHAKSNGRLETLAISVNNLYALEGILETTAKTLSDDYARELIDLSISNKNLDALKLLLENEILADAGLNYQHTALQEAVKNGQNDVVLTLIDYGADSKVKTSRNDNLLHLAAKNGDFEMVRILIEQGVSAKAKNKDKRRPEKVAKRAGHKSLAKYLKKARKGRL
ncbi:trypsin-like peptidase domain-containing protein [Winogradskyella tangerina]|uniref:trypsin-like peptidase domain-containing protein n=1 Tax=Winogradskyella tangerina TaxID=2023240 RepID=UPI0018E5A410|nr:trypsin-like peptidase domain-containing protein [Winogradskyella tangerina]